MASEKRQQALEKARKVKEKLKDRVGTLSSSAELIREDRSVVH
jgi:hypothetical protein